MTEPLVKIIERAGNHPKIIEYGGVTYYSSPYAAQVVGVTNPTMNRWIQEGKIEGCIQDPMSHQYFVPKEVVDKKTDRFKVNKKKIE